jgi:hypothetical protein
MPQETREAGGDENRNDEAQQLNGRRHRVEPTLDILHVAADGFDVCLQFLHVVFEAIDARVHVHLYASIIDLRPKKREAGDNEDRNASRLSYAPAAAGCPWIKKVVAGAAG